MNKARFETMEELIEYIKTTHHKRHREDEIVDEIKVDTVPRYKTSGMSGDEWRTSVRLRMYRKDTVLVEKYYHNMKSLAANLPWLMLTWMEDKNENWDKRILDDKFTCSQNGCSNPATTFYEYKKFYSREGYSEEPSEFLKSYVCFCKDHAIRGDCDLEDAERNYELLYQSETPVLDPKDISLSQFGGILSIDMKEEE